jgi:hypothetical protein
VLSVNIFSVLGHKVSLRYCMQEGEETSLHTSILHCITSRFFPEPVVGIMPVISNILTALPTIFVFWDKTRCKLINGYLILEEVPVPVFKIIVKCNLRRKY